MKVPLCNGESWKSSRTLFNTETETLGIVIQVPGVGMEREGSERAGEGERKRGEKHCFLSLSLYPCLSLSLPLFLSPSPSLPYSRTLPTLSLTLSPPLHLSRQVLVCEYFMSSSAEQCGCWHTKGVVMSPVMSPAQPQ